MVDNDEKQQVDIRLRMMELINRYPVLGEVLHRHGVFCDECIAANHDTLKEVAQMHGIDLAQLLAELQAAQSKQPRH